MVQAAVMKLEPQEFERLAMEQLDAIYRMARRLTRDENRTDDLVQETYLRAAARDNFDLQQFGMKPWLLRILYNLHLSRAQRDVRQPLAVDDDKLDAVPASSGDLPPVNPRSFEVMDQRLVHAIDELPDEYRSVLLLWALEELSYKEIADVLDVPIGTVMSRLHRTRQKLLTDLRDLAVEERIIRE